MKVVCKTTPLRLLALKSEAALQSVSDINNVTSPTFSPYHHGSLSISPALPMSRHHNTPKLNRKCNISEETHLLEINTRIVF